MEGFSLCRQEKRALLSVQQAVPLQPLRVRCYDKVIVHIQKTAVWTQ